MQEVARCTANAWNELNAIEGIGEVVATSIVEFFKEQRNCKSSTAAR